MNKTIYILYLLVLVIFLNGCRSVYYKAMEKIGFQKRDILVDRIEDALDSQKDAKEQFKTTLEKFSELTGYTGGELEETYEKLQSELDDSENEAKELRERIESVEQVAEDLFEEWETELAKYNDRELRRKSSASLQKTKTRYNTLIASMKNAERKIDPVLVPLRDRVLFLKHNLNANAIASLDKELKGITTDASSLIKAIESSIAEADRFLKEIDEE